jgi:hypothetical protein
MTCQRCITIKDMIDDLPSNYVIKCECNVEVTKEPEAEIDYEALRRQRTLDFISSLPPADYSAAEAAGKIMKPTLDFFIKGST